METVEQLVSFNHIQVQLSGGAPWGFTLKGGLEHGEPLIITKIEDDGKAELCRKLRVGDELININGSALYGSRQEALILIKGSYRILKITVRRYVHTHTHTHAHGVESTDWGQLSRPYSSTDRSSSLGSMESLDTPTPTPRPCDDAHPSPVDSALSKRDSAYSSFSASSNASEYAAAVSLRPGEADSMDNLLQSLGTSGPGSAVGRAPVETAVTGLKSRSLTRPKTRPAVGKERPSSCCYEEELRGGVFGRGSDGDKEMVHGANPPRPPTRKDSFRATRSRKEVADAHCVSGGGGGDGDGVVGDAGGSKPSRFHHEPETHNGCSAEPGPGDSNGHFTGRSDPVECYFSGQNQSEALQSGTKTDYMSDHHKVHPVPSKGFTPLPATTSSSSSSDPAASPPEPSLENQGELQLSHPRAKSSSHGEPHRHSAPENLLTTAQLQSLHLNGDASLSGHSDHGQPPPSGPSPSPPCSSGCLDLHGDQQSALDPSHHLQPQQNSWEGSRCSTPGSVFLELDGSVGDAGGRSEAGEGGADAGSGFSPVQAHHTWGRSVSVPGESGASSSANRQGGTDGRVVERDVVPLSAAASLDSLLEEQRGGGGGGRGGGGGEVEDGEAVMKKLNSSKNRSRNRRRGERFATNLRNEIQRKKAQLQTCRSPGGLLHSGETVHEEEGLDFQDQGGGDPGASAQERSTNAGYSWSTAAPESRTTVPTSESSQGGLRNDGRNQDSQAQVLDLTTPSFGVSIRVVEELAPAGKARRWRWTPEHKLQPERGRRSGAERPGSESRQGVCTFTSTAASSSTSYVSTRSYSTSRIEESEILPFADRMKFFEETSRSGSVSGLSGLSANHPRRQPSPVAEPRSGELSSYRAQRRYSYQGVLPQENTLLPGSAEARRQSKEPEPEDQQERPSLCGPSELDLHRRTGQGFHHEGQQDPLQAQLPHGQARNQLPRSAFYSVGGPSQLQAEDQGCTSRSYTPREGLPQAEHTRAHRAAASALALRGRAIEVDEGDREPGPIRKKVPPPPRPPPPKWEEFRRRRASHHKPSRQRSYSLPPERHQVLGVNQDPEHTGLTLTQPQLRLHQRPLASPTANQHQAPQTQDRPYSHAGPEPFQDHRFAIAPPSPMFSRRAFRPVAPPPRERGGAWRSQPEARPRREPEEETGETGKSLPRHQASHRPVAQWERTRTPSPRMHCDTALPPTTIENGTVPTSERYDELQRNHRGFQNDLGNAGGLEPQTRVTEPQAEPAGTESETTRSPSPAHSLEAELDVPMETDIDDYQEEEGPLTWPGAHPITSEHPCLALPVTVVETDIDMSPHPEGSSPGR
ncbi:hypothetical protein NHX12_014162, partial [Muraenolepis orangiensis]